MKKIITTIIAGGLLLATAIPAHATFASSSETVAGTMSHTTLSERINADYTNAVRAAVTEKLQYEAAVRVAVAEKWHAEAAAKVITPTQALESPVSPVEPFYTAPAPVTPTTQESPAPAVTGGSADAWASSAQAQAVIQCESGGNYSTNTGNGYYGAWQFDAGTWLANGGGAYAPTADQATPSQQNEIAYNTYQSRGWQPWACAQ